MTTPFKLLICLAVLAACGAESEPVTGERGGLLILTTRDFVARSEVLPRFVAQKERRGFRVRVVDEDDFGGDGLVGQPRALRIRDYLRLVRDHGYTHLLLIGDGHPQYGDVPMFTVWPRHAQPADLCLSAFALDCRSCQTDQLYANLTGDWDLNGNGRPGEHGLDEGPGGIDFHPDLIVGRIPVYLGRVDEGDRILQHALDYMNQSSAQAAYRRRVLLMGAMLYYRGQELAAVNVAQDLDGAATGEWMVQHVLRGQPGVTYRRLYEREGIAPSSSPGDAALTAESATVELGRGYGMVFWSGHGLPTRVVRVVWNGDDDNDGKADHAELTSPPFLRAQDAEQIAPGQPGFAVAASCEVGSADVPHNLSHSLLLAGAVVGMVGSSSVTPGSETATQPELDRKLFGADNAAVLMFEGLLAGESAAAAFARARETLGQAQSADVLAGKMMLNYFGDPTLTLEDTGPER